MHIQAKLTQNVVYDAGTAHLDADLNMLFNLPL